MEKANFKDILFICEKPSVARDLARVLSKHLGVNALKRDGFFELDSCYISWCFGHMYELASPDYYEERYKKWTIKDLPIFPQEFVLLERLDEGVQKQLNVFRGLAKKGLKVVVNTGDPDREGQRLVDDVIYTLNLNKKAQVNRCLITDNTEEQILNAVAKSFSQDNEKYRPLAKASLMRAIADWTIGMNCSRVATLTHQLKNQSSGVFPIGRVQTPLLGLIVQRDKEIKNFTKIDYGIITASFGNTKHLHFDMKKNQTKLSTLEKGFVLNSELDNFVNNLNQGKVTDTKREEVLKTEERPLGDTIASCQKALKNKLDAESVALCLQSLYEKGYTTYPRTDSKYLPTTVLQERGFDQAFIEMLPITNDKKTTVHHAIIPTNKKINLTNLNSDEEIVYKFIEKSFKRATCKEECTFLLVTYHATIKTCDGEFTFKKQERIFKTLGFRQYDDEIPQTEIKEISSDFNCAVQKTSTTPPKSFFLGDLPSVMENAHLYLKQNKSGNGDIDDKTLKSYGGIGTSATRTSIIKGLSTHNLIQIEKNKVTPTENGKHIFEVAKYANIDLELTIKLEQALDRIQDNTASTENFLKNLKALTIRAIKGIYNGVLQ